MKIEKFILCAALLLITSGANGDPVFQPAIVTDWTGQRDADGNATGYGTLRSYRLTPKFVTGSNVPMLRKTLISQESGKMVRGKLQRTGEALAAGSDVSQHEPGSNSGKPASEVEARDKAVEQSEQADHLKPSVEISRDHGAERSIAPPAEGPSTAKTSVAARPPGEAMPEKRATRAEGQGTDDLRSTSAAPTAHPILSKAEVIRLADEQAQSDGYNVADYQGRLVRYNAPDDTWSVSYKQKPPPGTTETGKHFGVIVEDKTNKTSIAPGN